MKHNNNHSLLKLTMVSIGLLLVGFSCPQIAPSEPSDETESDEAEEEEEVTNSTNTTTPSTPATEPFSLYSPLTKDFVPIQLTDGQGTCVDYGLPGTLKFSLNDNNAEVITTPDSKTHEVQRQDSIPSFIFPLFQIDHSCSLQEISTTQTQVTCTDGENSCTAQYTTTVPQPQ